MIMLLAISFLLLAVSAALIFGPSYVLMGAGGVRLMARRPEYRFMGGMLASAAIGLVCLPFVSAGLISGGETAQMFAQNMSGLSWRL